MPSSSASRFGCAPCAARSTTSGTCARVCGSPSRAQSHNISSRYSLRMTDLARQLLPLIDLTSLNAADDEAAIRRLASLACTPAGNVAAVCIWPRFIPVARAALHGTGIAIAVVTNFPDGAGSVETAANETAAAVKAGADEIDVVFPYRALLSGDADTGLALVRACREA